MEIEHKLIDLNQFKFTDEGPGTIEGYTSVFGELDDGADIALPGNYTDTLPKFLKQGFTAQSHDWSYSGVVGFPTSAREDDHGLYVVSQFHSTADAQDVRTKARERMEAGKDVKLSIGYRPVEVKYIYPAEYEKELPAYIKAGQLSATMEKAKKFPRIRLLVKTELFEHSIVTVPMLNSAQASSIKSVKGASGKSDWPLAARDRAWDGSAAHNRIVSWAKKEDGTIDPAKMRSVHFWYDPENSENIGAYKLLFADVIDSEIKAIPRGIFAVAGVLQGARGGADIDDVDAVKGKVESYYRRMAKEWDDESVVAPWKKEQEPPKSEPPIDIKGLFEEELAAMVPTPWDLWNVFCCVIWKIMELEEAVSETGVSFDTASLLNEAINEFVARLRTSLMAMIAMPEEGEEAITVSGHRPDAAPLAAQAVFVLKALEALTKRFKNYAAWRKHLKEGRTISAANAERMKTAQQKIKDTVGAMQEVHDDLENLISMAEPKPKEKDFQAEALQELARFERLRTQRYLT